MPVATKGKKMNKLVTAVLAFTAMVAAASAANLSDKKVTPAPAAPAIEAPASWYVGVNGGGVVSPVCFGNSNHVCASRVVNKTVN